MAVLDRWCPPCTCQPASSTPWSHPKPDQSASVEATAPPPPTSCSCRPNPSPDEAQEILDDLEASWTAILKANVASARRSCPASRQPKAPRQKPDALDVLHTSLARLHGRLPYIHNTSSLAEAKSN